VDKNMIYAAGIHLREHLRHTPYKNTDLYSLIENLITKANQTSILPDEDIDALEKELYATEKIEPFSPSMTLDGTLGIFALVLRVYSSHRKPALRIAIAVEEFRMRIQKK
jgi:hypothetical protein